ncbi:hypothetical protein ACN47E_003327 [Coniothyrium glycines]
MSTERPPIPSDLPTEDVIAIVSVHDPQASNANSATSYRKSQISGDQAGSDSGCYIFLTRVDGQPCFTFGRHLTKTSTQIRHDVYLPGAKIGLRQLALIPSWDANSWRLQSTSEVVTTVNGVPIQVLSSRTKKKNGDGFPEAVYLEQDSVNHAMIHGLQIDIWLLKTVRQVYPTKISEPAVLPSVQDVSQRTETWAQQRYMLGRVQVSSNSIRVIERFTGNTHTAKLFRDELRGRQQRDEEFEKLRKVSTAEADLAVVRYLETTEIGGIPAIITSTHEALASFAALQLDIQQRHPGMRFTIATKLLRRLFSALAFLHHHGIVHGQVTQESVLLRVGDLGLDTVLLVNYAASTLFPSGTVVPMAALLEDGRAAMVVVDDCCDIWQLRKAATKDAMNEEWMADKTLDAKREYDIVQRVVADYFGAKGGSRTSDKGKRLLRLLELKQLNWESCQDNQIHNATRREVGPCIMSNLIDMSAEWDRAHPASETDEKPFMILSLGHPWLDNLASQLYHDRWDTTPRDVCTKIKEVAGADEEPWQTIEVTKSIVFKQTQVGIDEDDFLSWLAGCCDVYPRWRKILESECESRLRSQNGAIPHQAIDQFRQSLTAHGSLPNSMTSTLKLLTDNAHRNTQSVEVVESYQIWHHVPSRRFNLTQLQVIASSEKLASCINDGLVRCDDYIEVRGEPKLQGCYASISQLEDFTNALGLTIGQTLDKSAMVPSFDPADFSQVSPGKIVLAHTGLLAYASVTRSGDQFVFHAPKYPESVDTAGSFLPTYFGDMKVLPRLPAGVWEHARPDHWSKFKNAEDLEDASNIDKRKILLAKPPTGRQSSAPKTASLARDVEDGMLGKYLKQRQMAISQARPLKERNTDAASSKPGAPVTKRTKASLAPEATTPSGGDDGKVSMSFVNRAAQNMERMAQSSPGRQTLSLPRIPAGVSFFHNNANVTSSPPRAPVNADRSFTVASGSFDIEDDWKQTEQWLKHLPAEDVDRSQMQGLFNFQFHHSHMQSASDTEEESAKASQSSVDGIATNPGAAIAEWQAANQGNEDDMPDTDVESFDKGE